ncbi:hypothetical protein A2U01_0058456, partial [Trifolium medium]|nr:hypothetical protein [Trifolium medium]
GHLKCALRLLFSRPSEKKEVGGGDQVEKATKAIEDVRKETAAHVSGSSVKTNMVVLENSSEGNAQLVVSGDQSFAKAMLRRVGLGNTNGDDKVVVVEEASLANNKVACVKWNSNVEVRRWASNGIVGIV